MLASISLRINCAVLAIVVAVTYAISGVAFAQSDETLDVTARGMTATAVFERSTPCTPYELSWGDGEEEVVEDEADICIQVIDRVSLHHEYEEEGDYTVALTLAGKVYEEEVTVPAEVISFDLDDVESITSQWIDPSEQIADEEYYIYTITLDDGKVIKVQATGFTTREYRNEQFQQAGYTGDVDALLAMVEEYTEDTSSDANSIYQQLITAMQTLIERMQQLLQLQ